MTRPHSLLAYDASGTIAGTLDYLVAHDEHGEAGFVDFAAHEEAGGEHIDIWIVSNAVGSKVWPEWLGGAAHDFRVELTGPPGNKRISALVHKTSGHRRERADIEAAIAERIAQADGAPADIRDLVGGPNRPIRLDLNGRTAARGPAVKTTLPLVARK
jgi:hypothetical protein